MIFKQLDEKKCDEMDGHTECVLYSLDQGRRREIKLLHHSN